MKIKLTSLLHASLLSYIALFINFIFATLLIHFTSKSTYAFFAHSTAFITILGTIFTFGHMRSFVRYDGVASEMAPVASLAIIFWFFVIVIISTIFIKLYINNLNVIDVSLVLIVASTIFTAMLLPLWQWNHKVITYNYWMVGMGLMKVFWLLLFYIFPQDKNSLFALNALTSIILTLSITMQTDLFQPKMLLVLKQIKHITLSLLKHTYFVGVPFWISLIASTLYIRVDIILLNALHVSQTKIGVYAYIETIIFAILLLPGAISNLITRALIAKEIDGYTFWKQYGLPAIGIACILSLIAALVLPEIVQWLLGKTRETYQIIAGFTPGIAFAFLATFFNLALVTDKHLKQVAFCNVITAISCILLNMYLIPRFGVIGSAYATSLTYCILSSSFLIFCIKNNAWQFRKLYGQLITVSFIFCLGFVSWIFYLVIPFAFFLPRISKKRT